MSNKQNQGSQDRHAATVKLLRESIQNLPEETAKKLHRDLLENTNQLLCKCRVICRECMEDLSAVDYFLYEKGSARAKLDDELAELLWLQIKRDTALNKLKNNAEKTDIRNVEIARYYTEDRLAPEKEHEAMIDIYGIKTYLTDEAIYIKTPLCPRKSVHELWENGPTDLDKVYFTDYITASIESTPNYLKYDFNRYNYKSIFLLYVYPKNDRTTQIPDTDNHNSRAVINEICEQFITGDTALTTDIRAMVTLSDVIEPGTYITVLPGLENTVKSDKVIRFWAQKRP